MKTNLLFASAVVLMLVSCNNDTENVMPAVKEITISANMEIAASSRTNFTPVGDFFWTKDDKIKVYTTAGSFDSFKVISGEGTASATFSGSISGSTSTCAVFPADAAGTVTGSTLTFNAPTGYTYKYEQSDFASEMTPTVNSTNIPMLAKIATVGSTNLNFKNLGGVFCFKFKDIPANTCKIVFTANSKICGPFTVDLSASEPTITTTETTNPDYKSISVGFAASTEKTNRVVYIPVPCGTYTGYEVEMFDESGNTTAYLESTKTKVIERSTALRFNEITITTLNGGIEGGGTSPNMINGHEYVDLGLPSGLKWATCNIGANTPEGFGDYYAFGDLTPCEKGYLSNADCATAGKTIAELQSMGYLDENRILNLQYDVANYLWGSTWRIPTDVEIIELISNTTRSKEIINEVSGLLWTSKINANSIFTPFTDIGQGHSDSGDYRSSKAAKDSYCCFGLMTGENSDGIYTDYDSDRIRQYGFSVRPVSE